MRSRAAGQANRQKRGQSESEVAHDQNTSIQAGKERGSEHISARASKDVGARRGMERWRESRQQCRKTLQALRRSRVSSERTEGVVRDS